MLAPADTLDEIAVGTTAEVVGLDRARPALDRALAGGETAGPDALAPAGR